MFSVSMCVTIRNLTFEKRLDEQKSNGCFPPDCSDVRLRTRIQYSVCTGLVPPRHSRTELVLIPLFYYQEQNV